MSAVGNERKSGPCLAFKLCMEPNGWQAHQFILTSEENPDAHQIYGGWRGGGDVDLELTLGCSCRCSGRLQLF